MGRSYNPKGKTSRRPTSFWDDIPAGVRGALISFGILLLLFACNGLGLALFSATNLSVALIFYPAQMLFYILNGIFAGGQADSTRAKKTRQVGHQGERVQLNRPNYLLDGAVAGLTLAILAAIVYFVASNTATQILPGLQLTGWGDTPLLFLALDAFAAISLGMVGGLIYDRYFAAPSR